jgi:hypothetical protein
MTNDVRGMRDCRIQAQGVDIRVSLQEWQETFARSKSTSGQRDDAEGGVEFPSIGGGLHVATPVPLRDAFVGTISHIRSAAAKATANSGPGRALSAPDLHKISEGLFLSAVTHWEEFCQALFMVDLATLGGSTLLKDVKKFRTKNASHRLAEAILSHIDHPNAFYDWSDFNKVCERADRYLRAPHRFSPPLPVPPAVKPAHPTALPTATVQELAMFKRIRNAVAHKSDKAWDSFMRLVKDPPFSLQPNQRKGITPGRFIVTQQWGGKVVLMHSLDTLENAAKTLVP